MPNKLLLIGINNYQTWKSLNNCVQDLTDFRDILVENYEFDEDDIIELFDKDATNEKIQETLVNYTSSISTADNLLIYFSGHGEYVELNKTGYWVPFDGGNHFSTWIANDTVLTLLDKIEAKHIFLISDSCFSNSILNPSIAKSNGDYTGRASRWALASAFKESYDAPKGENSPFATAIIDFLKTIKRDFKVSDLINHVKVQFTTEVRQTPQGSPLMLAAHKGGEMPFVIRNDQDSRKFKGYKDFERTLQIYSRNSDFTQKGAFENKSLKIGYLLYQEYQAVHKKVTYYLFLYEGINQNKTLAYLKQHHKEIFGRDLIILLSKERAQINLDARKAIIERKFSPLNIFYIDDFIRINCTPTLKGSRGVYLNNSNFVLPSIDSEVAITNIQQYIYDWFKKEDDPILVVIGTGGVGKTTFAQYVADNAIKVNNDTFVMFIDSVLIKDGLLKRKNNNSAIKLYDFYEALYEKNDMPHEKLSEELFRISIDAGNILLIIDGLDEVISKIPGFNVNIFLKSIADINREIGSGKVIITCRTHFWDNTDVLDSKFNKIDLLPFNNEQTKNFFDKSFKEDPVKAKKALKLADEFKYPGEEHNFHPYVLDIIRSILATDANALQMDLSEFNSRILKSSVNNDYIIYRICDRERKRIGQISVEDQLQFFIYLATEKRGVIDSKNFKESISIALNGKYIDKSNIEAFKAHPFLYFHDRTCRFRYDFLTDYFKGVYLTGYLEYRDEQEPITQLFIDLVHENCWFGSPIIYDIVNRVSNWDDEDIIYVSDIIENIAAQNIAKGVKKKTIANIFNICLAINRIKKGKGIDENTALLLALFQKRIGHIVNLAIIDVNSLDHKIKFDFTNLQIVKAHINNFSTFWECKMDSSTLFIECDLLNLKKIKKSEVAVTQANFRDCNTDATVDSVLISNQERNVDKREKAKDFLDSFFHLFLSNGRIEKQSMEDVIKVRFPGVNKYGYPFKEFQKILKKHNVVITYDNFKGSKIEIVDQYSEEVYKFVKDGTITTMIAVLIDEVSNLK